jgi:hypothetical protein
MAVKSGGVRNRIPGQSLLKSQRGLGQPLSKQSAPVPALAAKSVAQDPTGQYTSSADNFPSGGPVQPAVDPFARYGGKDKAFKRYTKFYNQKVHRDIHGLTAEMNKVNQERRDLGDVLHDSKLDPNKKWALINDYVKKSVLLAKLVSEFFSKEQDAVRLAHIFDGGVRGFTDQIDMAMKKSLNQFNDRMNLIANRVKLISGMAEPEFRKWVNESEFSTLVDVDKNPDAIRWVGYKNWGEPSS